MAEAETSEFRCKASDKRIEGTREHKRLGLDTKKEISSAASGTGFKPEN